MHWDILSQKILSFHPHICLTSIYRLLLFVSSLIFGHTNCYLTNYLGWIVHNKCTFLGQYQVKNNIFKN